MRASLSRCGLLMVALLAASSWANSARAQQLAGVHVDAEGVLRKQVFEDADGELSRQRRDHARASLNPQVAAKSALRKISLNRLERAIAEQQANGRQPTDEMRYLAGITRVRYVFYYPETKDIVIAGPAEGWVEDLSGRVCSLSTGRPVIELQDLVVALRTFGPQTGKTPVIGCSIDPTPEGLAKMQDFLRQVGGHATPGDTDTIVDGLRNSLGLQTVSVLGVPAKTHFAQVLVEADYRMKLIGIGLEQPPVKMISYVDKANPSQVSRNALQRWFFVPDYECVRASEDGLAMEIVGEGVKLIGENEMVAADGRRQQTGGVDKASQLFVQAFTKKYPQLAEKSPVYAQLRNLIDLSIAAAFIRQGGYYQKSGWTMDVLGSEQRFPIEVYPAPQQVETAVTSIWKGNQLMTPLGGGVVVEVQKALTPDHLLEDKGGKVAATRQEIELQLADGQWWWD